ncbi:uncharacterized protein LOC144037585 [Vanacampus margaritifer]
MSSNVVLLQMPRNMADFLATQPCEQFGPDPLLCWAALSAPAVQCFLQGHLPVNAAASSLTIPELSRRSSSALSPRDLAVTFVQHLCSCCCIDANSLKLTMPWNMAGFLATQPCERSAQIPQKLSDPLLCWSARSAPAGSTSPADHKETAIMSYNLKLFFEAI